ncbi:gene transfer agent family protein [Devosia sp. 2618]|uniref:gene transfer agent family protein n=1 Tax=Devosia sp. 2618 TaxID=3156454 RepID=UPI00339400B3
MHTAFFGDREREFSLTSKTILNELERTTGKGIGAIIDGLRRLSYAEITETIRLGLVGAGAQPEEAAALVSTYVPARPLGEANILAIDILTDLWVGPEQQHVNEATATGEMSAAINLAQDDDDDF